MPGQPHGFLKSCSVIKLGPFWGGGVHVSGTWKKETATEWLRLIMSDFARPRLSSCAMTGIVARAIHDPQIYLEHLESVNIMGVSTNSL